jgi:hypothetical protein
MRTHQEIDERSLELARAIVAKIDADPERRGLEHARDVCRRWGESSRSAAVVDWRAILTREWTQIREVLLDNREPARQLRQSSPFCGVLTPRERWAIYRRYRERDARTA